MSDQVSNSIPEISKVVELVKRDRGIVGVATPSLAIKQLYHQAFFKREDANSKHNHNKKVWVKTTGAPSLKQFARRLAKEGDVVAKEWLQNKLGAKDAKRSDTNIAAAKAAASATKSAKKSTKK